MDTVTFQVEGMHCDGCAETIKALLDVEAGVKASTVSFKEGEARVLYDLQAVTEEQLIALIERGGYRVTVRNHG